MEDLTRRTTEQSPGGRRVGGAQGRTVGLGPVRGGGQGPEHSSWEENDFTVSGTGLLSRKMHDLIYVLKRSVWLSRKRLGWESTGAETASF